MVPDADIVPPCIAPALSVPATAPDSTMSAAPDKALAEGMHD
jgi:hypothetical protein